MLRTCTFFAKQSTYGFGVPHFNYGIDMVLFVMIALRNLIEAA